MSRAIEMTPAKALPFPQALRFAGWAALWLTLLYAPYPPDSLPVRVLSGYIALVARASAWLIALGDPSARLLDEVLISGRFPLQIVLDCTAVDVQALYLAAVSSTPFGWRRRALGALAGCAALSVLNLGRIVLLYWVGVHAPAQFDLLHEDVLTFALLGAACASFWAFTRVAQR